MSPVTSIDLLESFKSCLFCIFLIGLVLGVNGFIYLRAIHFFRSGVGHAAKPSKLKATFFFIICTQILALAQFVSIAIWAISIISIGLIPDWVSAVLLSASSYTTLGDFTYALPSDWHLLPAFIAFSGLFSFSWAATSTITMVSSFNQYIDSFTNSHSHYLSSSAS